MADRTNILFIADIVGEPGLQITEKLLPNLLKKYQIDFCIANGENVTHFFTQSRDFLKVGSCQAGKCRRRDVGHAHDSSPHTARFAARICM